MTSCECKVPGVRSLWRTEFNSSQNLSRNSLRPSCRVNSDIVSANNTFHHIELICSFELHGFVHLFVLSL